MNDVIRAFVGALAAVLFSAALVPQASADWMDLPLHRPLAPKRQTDARKQVTTGLNDTTTQLAFTKDGKLLLGRAGDHVIRAYEPATGKQVREFGSEKDAWLGSFALTPDGKHLVAAALFRVKESFRRRIAVYDLATGELVRDFATPNGLGGTLCLTPDGKGLIVGGGDKWGETRPRLIDAETGDALAIVDAGRDGNRLALSPDGKTLAIGPSALGRKPVLYDLGVKKVSQELAEMPARPVDQLLFSPDGKELAVVTGGVVLYDIDKKAKARCTLVLDKVIGGALMGAYSPDGRLLALAGGRPSVVLWDRKENRLYEDFSGYTGQACGTVAFSPDGKTLAVSVAAAPHYEILLFDVPRPKKEDKK